MSATTKLQFTLSSPGSDPTPTPTPTPTPSQGTTTPGYYTSVVGSPNTGENSASSDNGGGTVFTALFAVIGLTALAVFLVKYLKKNRHISFAERGSFHISARPRVFATVALTLAVAFLGGITITNMYNNAKNTNAASQRELDVNVKSNIIFNVDRGGTSVETDAVEVANNGAKYDLYISSTNNKFSLESNPSSVFLSPVTGNITATDISKLSTPNANEWGVSLLGDDISGQMWAAAPTTETKIKSDITTSKTTVSYGVNLGSDLPDGTYSTAVSYRAVAKNYKVTVINGFVNEDGSDTEDWFDADVDVKIRENCSANQAFLRWTVVEGQITADKITTTSKGRTYHFTMPASDVTVKAECEGSTPDPTAKWEIHYDKNATAATGTMANQVVTSEPTTLTANGYTYTGYTFQGWACSKSATTKDFDNSQGNITQSALEAKKCTRTPGNGESNPPSNDYYTLYAIWSKGGDTPPPDPEYIQDVTPEMCEKMAFFEVKTLPDRRDNKNYSYTKFGDGRCWMLSDLDYRPTGSTTLTVADTDVSQERTVTFGTSGSVDGLYKTQDGYSTLYNYNAATGGYWKGASKAVNKIIPDSLCPASWKIPDASHNSTDPTYGTKSGEFYGLWNYNVGKANGYGSSASDDWKRNFLFGTSVAITGGSVTAPHLTYNGSYDFTNNKWANKAGTHDAEPGNYASYFLSTTTTGDTSSSVWPAAFNPHKPGVDTDVADINVTNPAHGSAVRCVLRTTEQRTRRDAGADTGDATEND